VGDLRRRVPLHRMEGITMLHKTRFALAVIAIVAVSVLSTAGSASALGVYGGGDYGLFGFGLVLP
jgi:hypothetical protein